MAKQKTIVRGRLGKRVISQWQLYILLLPALFMLILFHYVPMYGVTIAFKDLGIGEDMLGGTWVGFKHFERLFRQYFKAHIN